MPLISKLHIFQRSLQEFRGKIQLGKKMKKEKEKRRKITSKNWGKGLKNTSFLVINLFVGEKMNI